MLPDRPPESSSVRFDAASDTLFAAEVAASLTADEAFCAWFFGSDAALELPPPALELPGDELLEAELPGDELLG